jgi:hypothetical protein
VPPEKYDTRRLLGMNTKRAAVAHPRTPATVAHLLGGPSAAGLVSKVGRAHIANPAEVLAGLVAALDTAVDQEERDQLSDLIAAIKPLAAIAGRRQLTPEEQEVVEEIARGLLGTAEAEATQQAQEEQAHQAARVAEFEDIARQHETETAAGALQGRTKASAIAGASELEAAATKATEAANLISAEIHVIEATREEEEKAAGRRQQGIAKQATKLAQELDQIEAEQAALTREVLGEADDRNMALAARDRFDAEAKKAAAHAKRIARAIEHISPESQRDIDELSGARDELRDLERAAAEMRAQADAAEHSAQDMTARITERRAAHAQLQREKVAKKGKIAKTHEAAERIELSRREVTERLEQAKAEAVNNEKQARADAAAATLSGEDATGRAVALPEGYAATVRLPKLPRKAPRAHRRARAAAAREEEDARAVEIVRQGLEAVERGRAPREAGEERKVREPESPRRAAPRPPTKNAVSELLKVLRIPGHTRVREHGAEEGLRMLREAEADGTIEPGKYARVMANIAAGRPLNS